jgi:uncharacterized tellurite resistance protein B-like protein
MSFWEMFIRKEKDQLSYGTLHLELQRLFPSTAEDELVKITCVAGLLARVAYVDFHMDQAEIEHMHEALKDWTSFDEMQRNQIVQIAIKNIKELAGLENHIYVHRLKSYLSVEERFTIIETLFALAASDGVVENIESEEIRIINKGFDLSDQHFIVARAKVSDKLKALKR